MGRRKKIRNVRYSIGLKFGIFVAVILISAMSIVGIFIVRQQETTLLNNMGKNMESYLLSYRKVISGAFEKAIEKFLDRNERNKSKKEALKTIQNYTISLTNIPNCETAMFIQSAFPGTVFANSSGLLYRSINPPKPIDEKFLKKYKSVDFFLTDMVDDSKLYFVQSSKFTEAEYSKLEKKYKKSIAKYKTLKENIEKENKKIKNENIKNKKKKPYKRLFIRKPKKIINTAYYEGFLPVYINFYKLVVDKYARFNHLNEGMKLYRKWAKRNFSYNGVQGINRLNDLKFITEFERIYFSLYKEVKKNNFVIRRKLKPYAKFLMKRRKFKLSYNQINYIRIYMKHLRNYRKGYYSKTPRRVFTKKFLDYSVKIFKDYYKERLNNRLKKIVKLAETYMLFKEPASKKDMEEIKTARMYLKIAELFTEFSNKKWKKLFTELSIGRFFPKPFRPGEQFILHIAIFKNYFKKYLKTGVFPLPNRLTYTRLGRIYTPKKNVQEQGAFYKHVFRVLVTPFKIGQVRIILSTKRIKKDLNKVAFRTVDLSVSLALRLMFITFLLSGLMVKDIKILAAGVESVGKGDLDTKIEVGSSDELGQLADQFNIMIRDIKDSQQQMVEKSRMEEELKIAEQIQASLLPKKFPEIPGYEFAGYYKSQTEAGGDYYDLIDPSDIGKGHFGMVSADVSGHGVGSGLVMSMVRSVLRAQAMGRADAKEVLCRVNPQIFKDTLPTMFATAVYITVNYEKNIMYYASAGHDPVILYNSINKELKMLPAQGIPLGMADANTFNSIIEVKKQELKKGDIVLLYTDGVTEAMNISKEEYQEERLCDAVKKYGSLSLEEMLNAIVEDVKKFTNNLPQEDDISLLAMKVL